MKLGSSPLSEPSQIARLCAGEPNLREELFYVHLDFHYRALVFPRDREVVTGE